MDKGEDIFRDKLRDLADSKDFHFEESDWNSARDYIDRQRSERRRRGFYYIAASLLFTAMFIFVSLPEQSTGLISVRNNVAGQGDPRNSSLPDEQTIITSPSETEKAAASGIADPQETRPTRLSPAKLSDINLKNEPVAPAKVISGKPAEHPDIVRSTPVKTKGDVTIEREAAIPVVAESAGNNAGTSAGTTDKDLSGSPIPPAMADNKSDDASRLTDKGNVPVTDRQPEEEEKTVDPDALVVSEPPAKEEEKKVPETVILSVPADSSGKPANAPELLLSAEAGAVWNPGWSYGSGRDGGGFNPTFGFSYYNHVTSEFALSFGIHYNRVSGLSHSSVMSKVTRYSLGEESDVTVITPSHLHYLTVPLRLQWTRDRKNTFGVGYNVSYLFNTYSEVETYSLRMGKRTSERRYRSAGYTEGFSIFDSQVELFYSRAINNYFDARIGFSYGLSDVKEDGFFELDKKERNAGIRLTLMYKMYRK